MSHSGNCRLCLSCRRISGDLHQLTHQHRLSSVALFALFIVSLFVCVSLALRDCRASSYVPAGSACATSGCFGVLHRQQHHRALRCSGDQMAAAGVCAGDVSEPRLRFSPRTTSSYLACYTSFCDACLL
jgi:hypothetical protein